jgi:hypothetical protein
MATHPQTVTAGLDQDTVERGVDGPFQAWEGDHTALVHVLWSAKHDGLTLDKDADAIASMILRSRWLAAERAETAVAASQHTEYGAARNAGDKVITGGQQDFRDLVTDRPDDFHYVKRGVTDWVAASRSEIPPRDSSNPQTW